MGVQLLVHFRFHRSCHIARSAGLNLLYSFARFARSVTSPSFAYREYKSGAGQALCVDLLLPRLRFNCCSPFASTSADGISILPAIASASTAPRLRRLWLLLPDCVRFNCSPSRCVGLGCCSRLRPLQLLPDCVGLGCSTSTAAPQLRPLQLLLPDCVRFDCCSLIACIRL